MGLGDRDRIGHVQFQVSFLGGESNYDSCPIACPITIWLFNIAMENHHL